MKEFEPVLPAVSVAEQVTVVAPSAKVEPDTGTHDTDGLAGPTASVAVGVVKITTAPLAPAASTVMSDVAATAGAVVSTTVTVKLPFAVLPAASVAEQFTVVVPRAKVVPEVGLHVTVGEAGLASVADAVYENTAPEALVASTVALAGRVRTGGAESQLMTFAVTFNATLRLRLPPPLRAPVAVTVTIPEAEPTVAVSTVIVVVRVALTVALPDATQLLGSVTEAGVVAESLEVFELTLKLTTALLAKTFVPELCRSISTRTGFEVTAFRHTSPKPTFGLEVNGATPSPSASVVSARAVVDRMSDTMVASVTALVIVRNNCFLPRALPP
ncbi:MAG: hypothetical protein ABJC24_08655 [Chloroflexota bacterium]